jgi:DNA (cytosine-5)-methyltransferase 1
LENVKHLTNHDNGKTWKIIIETLKKLNYIVNYEPLIISPHEYNIPQERQRVFIIGILKNKKTKKYNKINFDNLYIDLNKNKKNNFHINDYNSWKEIKKNIENNFLEKNVANKYYLNAKNKKDKYLINVLNAWEKFIKNIKTPKGRTIPVIWLNEFLDLDYNINHFSKWKQKYIQDMRIIYKMNKKFIDNWMKKYDVINWKKREQKLEWQAGKDIRNIKDSFIQLRQSGIRCKRPIKFPTLVAMVQIPIIFDNQKNKWRKLTPRETSNLQCFPEDFKIFSDLSSNKNADFYSYKQFGNSVNVNIVSKIQKFILNEKGLEYVK